MSIHKPYEVISLLELIDLSAEPLARISTLLGRLKSVSSPLGKMEQFDALLEEEKGKKHWAGELQEYLKRLGCTSSLQQIERFFKFSEAKVNKASSSWTKADIEGFRQILCSLIDRIHDDLASKVFLALPQDKVEWYVQKTPICSKQLEGAFPSTIPEIEEAAKCFALDRYTASVFHCMRALEPAIYSMAAALSVPVTNPNWHHVITNIETAVNLINLKENPDKVFYAEAAVHFRFLKEAWRNHTMHLRNRYDESSARKVLSNVKDFIEHLSTKLAEPSPQP